MSNFVNTNLSSLNAQRNLSSSQGSLATSMQRLSSGLRVNSAKDDAAGLAIATRMDAQARGMNVAIRNANDAISLAQVAEGALGKVGDMLQRMRELAVQAANATNGTADRANLDLEFQELRTEIERTMGGAKFNEIPLFDNASEGTGFAFQVGANSGDAVTIKSKELSGAGKVIAAATKITDATEAGNALTAIDGALTTINSTRATWGAAQNRFEATIAVLQTNSENQTAARSRIMDADFAKETAALTRAQILQQAGTAMLAQANQVPQQVLSLIKG